LNIGERLKAIREQKNLSQGHIEKSTGLLRCYVSRVENGHTVPSIETLEKFARALEVPMYALFYEGENPPEMQSSKHGKNARWGSSGSDSRMLDKFRKCMSRMDAADRDLLFSTAKKLSRRKNQ
jgi:transcriptional regulator with XRE-family HTH domain